MGALFQDLKFGLRMLAKNPGFTAVAVITLALGIGANTAIFSVVNAVLLRPLPFPDSSRLMAIGCSTSGENAPGHCSFPDYQDFTRQNHSFQAIGVYRQYALTLIGHGQPQVLGCAYFSASMFDVLRVRPELGRRFDAQEDQPGGNPVVVISDNLWKKTFGADPHVIGEAIRLDDQSYTIVGVTPPVFEFPLNSGVEAWIPETHDTFLGGKLRDIRGAQALSVLGRLKPGVRLQQAQAEMTAIASRLEHQYPKDDAGMRIRVVGLQQFLVGNARTMLWVLLAAVGFVLLIACTNVANLMLTRAAGQEKEIAIRAALGASRGRLIQRALVESLVLAGLGGALGLLIATWAITPLTLFIPTNIPGLKNAHLDWPVLAFTVGVSILTGLVFGSAPAIFASKPDLVSSLKEGGRSSGAGTSRRGLRNVLVVAEQALAIILLVGAGLALKSFYRLTKVNPGFDPNHALGTTILLPESRYPTDAVRASFYQKLLTRLKTLSGAEDTALGTTLPLTRDTIATDFIIPGRPAATKAEQQQQLANTDGVSPDYFRVLGISLLRGRAFTADDVPDSTPVAIISESLARRYWPHQDPIGRQIILDFAPLRPNVPRTIVGVVMDVRHQSLDQPVTPAICTPYLQTPWPVMSMAVRTAGKPELLAKPLETALLSEDPDLVMDTIRPLSFYRSQSLAPKRFDMMLLGLFAALALILAGVGIYGVISYSVTLRTHEIGIRMALGAAKNDVLRMVLRQGMFLTFLGIVMGWGGGLLVTRFLASLLYGVKPTDPATFISVSIVLTTVAALACYIPARRATKVDPMVALRQE